MASILVRMPRDIRNKRFFFAGGEGGGGLGVGDEGRVDAKAGDSMTSSSLNPKP